MIPGREFEFGHWPARGRAPRGRAHTSELPVALSLWHEALVDWRAQCSNNNYKLIIDSLSLHNEREGERETKRRGLILSNFGLAELGLIDPSRPARCQVLQAQGVCPSGGQSSRWRARAPAARSVDNNQREQGRGSAQSASVAPIKRRSTGERATSAGVGGPNQLAAG